MSDVEKQAYIGDVHSDPSLGHSNGRFEEYQQPTSAWGRFKDGFKPARVESIDTTGMTKAEVAAVLAARQPLKRRLKSRHIQMIAIGGSIGTGLFVGSGNSFATGGPAGVVLVFCIIGIMLFCTMMCLGEMAVRYPVAGSFSVFSTRFLDPSWGFAMGWNYTLNWLVVYPFELITGTLVIGYWNDDNNAAAHVNPAAWVALFWVVIGVINIFGVRGYGEAEFFFAIIKVAAVIGFCIFGIVVAAGGGPGHHYYGAEYWHSPYKAFTHGAKGVITAFVNAAFAFTGTELSGLAAAETENPAKTLPRAIKQVFWRILLFYVVSLTIVSMLVPANDPHFGTVKNGKASPFVIAIQNAHVHALPSIFNAVIVIAVLSVANSAVYGASRMLAAMAAQGQAPSFLGYIDRQGRPLYATLVTLVFGLLCFLCSSDKRNEVFNWLLALAGLSSIFTWGSVCLAHIRFRYAMRVQGHSIEELSFTAWGGIWSAVIGFVINLVILVLNFWVAVWPIGASPNAKAFFESYLSAPIVLVFYLGHKLWTRNWPLYIRAQNIDLQTGVRDTDAERMKAEVREEKARIASKNVFYRIYRFWC